MGDSWSYKPDDNYKPAYLLIQYLVQVVSRGGNFLLNIGPSPEGDWDPKAYERLNEIGEWIKINGEAIYGTKPIYPYHEPKLAFTQKEDTAYVFYLSDREEKELPSKIFVSSQQPKPGSKVYFLGYNKALTWEKVNNGVIIYIPDSVRKNPPCKYAWCFKMLIK
jgi:alpha-L-fucosidase